MLSTAFMLFVPASATVHFSVLLFVSRYICVLLTTVRTPVTVHKSTSNAAVIFRFPSSVVCIVSLLVSEVEYIASDVRLRPLKVSCQDCLVGYFNILVYL